VPFIDNPDCVKCDELAVHPVNGKGTVRLVSRQPQPWSEMISPLMSDTTTNLGIVGDPKVGREVGHVVDNFGETAELLACKC